VNACSASSTPAAATHEEALSASSIFSINQCQHQEELSASSIVSIKKHCQHCQQMPDQHPANLRQGHIMRRMKRSTAFAARGLHSRTTAMPASACSASNTPAATPHNTAHAAQTVNGICSKRFKGPVNSIGSKCLLSIQHTCSSHTMQHMKRSTTFAARALKSLSTALLARTCSASNTPAAASHGAAHEMINSIIRKCVRP
jgi:hypothetical protein